MTETRYLQYLLDEIGNSVHNLNTIAVALSNLSSDYKVDPTLNIKWEPKNVNVSSVAARRYAVRSSIVFAAELLFEYMSSISNDPLWKHLENGLDFGVKLAAHDSKAKRFSEFCKSIPGIEREWFVLVELMCHWRNRIVHASTSKAHLSSTDRQFLESKHSEIYEGYRHFDIHKTLADYEADKVTLKEATTLVTFLIKCCRKIDEHYISSTSKFSDEIFHNILLTDDQFSKLTKQQTSDKRLRQVARYIQINFNYLPEEKLGSITAKYTEQVAQG